MHLVIVCTWGSRRHNAVPCSPQWASGLAHKYFGEELAKESETMIDVGDKVITSCRRAEIHHTFLAQCCF